MRRQVRLTPLGAIGRLARLAGPLVRHEFRVPPYAQVAELVDALVSGISGAIRGGSSPLLGTNLSLLVLFSLDWQREKN